MITDNKYIDIAHTISLNCVYSDGSKNYIKAILEFAEVYHEMELKKLRVADVSGEVCNNHRVDLEHFMNYSESICKNCKKKV
jgi:hypothetical protein